MAWTLTHGETTQSFEAWGLSGLTIELRNFDVGTASFSHPGAAYDGVALFAHGEAATIKLGETIVFQGKFAAPKRSGHGSTEVINYTVRDAWYELTRTPFPPDSTTGIAKLFAGGTNIGTMYSNVIGIAAAAGVNIVFGSAASLTIIPLEMETRDEYCDGVLNTLRRWCPDVTHWIDYSTAPPTIHFVRRGDASALSLALEGTAEDIDIDSMEDMQSSRVVLRYVRTNAGDDGPETEVLVDAYPSEAYDPGAIVVSMDLRGRTIETQSLETKNISSSARGWWSGSYEWLDPSNAGFEEGDDFAFDDTVRLMQNDDGEWVTDTSGSVYQIKDGGVPHWLATAKQVLVKATVKDFTLDGIYVAEYELKATVNACPVAGGIYARETFAGETPPSGLAQQLYVATHALHYQGQYKWSAAELSLPLPHCGRVLNLTGGAASSRGWTAMNAAIHTVQIDVPNAAVTISFGPPSNLSAQDLFSLSQVTRNQQPAQAYTAASGSGGIRRTAGTNSLAPKPTGGGHPFFINPRTDGTHPCTVVAGTVNGVPATNLSLVVSNSGTKYVYLDVSYTQALSANNYVTGFTGAVTCAIATGSSVPDDTSTHLYRLIATFVSGVKTMQAITSSMEVAVRGYNASAAFSTIWGQS